MTPAEIAKLPYRPCVGIMLVNAQNDIFVGQRFDQDSEAWQMPQGGIDAGESDTEAAYRELWEETGVTRDLVTLEAQTAEKIRYDLPHDIVPKIWKGRFRGQEQTWVLFRFHGTDADITIATEHPEFSAWRWMPADALIAAIVPFKRAVYEQVLAAFANKL